MYQDDEIICHCASITYKEIKDAILNGADTVELISDKTDAGISCGYCIEHLEIILEELNKN
jgi:NAD(P)H-nitrite reductase large subunit